MAVDITIYRRSSGEFQIELFADHVRGRLTGSEDLPRMPPARRGLGLQWGNGLFYSELRYNFVVVDRKILVIMKYQQMPISYSMPMRLTFIILTALIIKK